MTDSEQEGFKPSDEATPAVQEDVDKLVAELGIGQLPPGGQDALRKMLALAWLRGARWGVEYGFDQATARTGKMLELIEGFFKKEREK